MKLEKIKLSGFKSFVDTTVIPISGNLTAIVGPNGCGKSNIIDAVRWVMGESSAKHLRGGSMADVIFNGSSGRKPVSTASVELVFNNTEGKLGGEYAQYDTIAIKRQVSRDGQSLFMLNGSRCRRKDITDLFLGTGLGSRSYAIIEQGTISRMVEAKPDDLRVYIEEAAGISKYKERRNETETRMKHTRENLERLDDLRDEVDRQLKSLQKQAEKAEKYTALKKQERQYRLELLAMRWAAYHQAAQALELKLQSVATEHNRLFVALRELDSQIDTQRHQQKQSQQQLNVTQGDYYALTADVSALEQTIRHHETSHEETSQEIVRLKQHAEQFNEELNTDSLALEDIKQSLFMTEESLVVALENQDDYVERLQDSQQQRLSWQDEWDYYRTQSAKYNEQAEVQRVKLLQLENQGRQLQTRIDKLQLERDQLSATDLENDIEALDSGIEILEEQRDNLYAQFEQLQQHIREQRRIIKNSHDELHKHRSEAQHVKGKLTSLELLQQHAMGKDNKALQAWLTSVNLAEQPRLAEFLEVESGWDKALETVLGSYLEAVCVESITPLVAQLPNLSSESLTLLAMQSFDEGAASVQKLPRLLDKVIAPWRLSSILAGIYCADDDESAQQAVTQLAVHESVITPEGGWFGAGWVKISRTKDSKVGVLQREKEARGLKQRQEELHDLIEVLSEQIEQAESDLKEAENQRESMQQQHNSLGSQLSLKQAEFSAQSARLEQQQRRWTQISHELDDIHDVQSENSEAMAEARWSLEDAEQIIAEQVLQKQRLDELNSQMQGEYLVIEQAANEARQQVYSITAKIDNLRTTEQASAKQIMRLQTQYDAALERIAVLENKLQQTLAPLVDEKSLLEQKRVDKTHLEGQLKAQRLHQDEGEAALSRTLEAQTLTQRDLDKQKESLDTLRFEFQESRVRQQAVNEQLKELEAEADAVLKTLPQHAEESAWKKTVDDLLVQIERLGTINLTAIEEYKAQAERMKFLDEQQADLIAALHTLDQAINKIDKESRLRFKETFDKINMGLQEKFPKLFGGGQAYLELTDTNKEGGGRATLGHVAEQDLLEAGVNIIARPPGKRNSSIHLLSGGEKALTAVALVFSIFELNPAPFCLLDEVDAPLDDANVGRFSKMVEEMSASVQFLYISHNKVTMEIAKQLAGVTMKEPGVSRMVAVDIEEAVSLAEI
ncbi:MAG: chromosome segregation protein SMC [Methylovulum sp.]|nr:chromosome segregation protein SMC [Methylovulum sp.]MCF7999764.1 chromosome segregation protein SMC [Methylovulum sp.]